MAESSLGGRAATREDPSEMNGVSTAAAEAAALPGSLSAQFGDNTQTVRPLVVKQFKRLNI